MSVRHKCQLPLNDVQLRMAQVVEQKQRFADVMPQVARRAAKGGADGATGALDRISIEMRTLRKGAFQRQNVRIAHLCCLATSADQLC